MSRPRRRFELRLVLFFLSAVWGVAVAFDATTAAVKFGFVCGAVLLAFGLARVPSHVAWRGRDVSLLRIVVSGIPALIASYFLLTNDWSQPVEKVTWLDPLQQGFAAVQASLPLPALHPNVVGGVLAMLLPLQAAALVVRSPRPGHAATARVTTGGLALLALSLAALLATRLRGAWAALAIAGALWLMWRTYSWVRRHYPNAAKTRSVVFAGGLIPLVLLGTLWGPEWAAASSKPICTGSELDLIRL